MPMPMDYVRVLTLVVTYMKELTEVIPKYSEV